MHVYTVQSVMFSQTGAELYTCHNIANALESAKVPYRKASFVYIPKSKASVFDWKRCPVPVFATRSIHTRCPQQGDMYNIHKPLLRAFWASLVIASASSRMISLKPDLKMVRVLAKLRIAPLTIPIPLSSDALSCVCCEWCTYTLWYQIVDTFGGAYYCIILWRGSLSGVYTMTPVIMEQVSLSTLSEIPLHTHSYMCYTMCMLTMYHSVSSVAPPTHTHLQYHRVELLW